MLSMGKSTISMTLFNSYVMLIYQRVYPIDIPLNHYNYEKLAATDWARSKYFFFHFFIVLVIILFIFFFSFMFSFIFFYHFFIILFFIFYHFFIIFLIIFSSSGAKKNPKIGKLQFSSSFFHFLSFFYHFCFRWWN